MGIGVLSLTALCALGGGAPYRVKDINTNVSPASSFPTRFQKLGNLAFFSTSLDYNGYKWDLWRTDGTEAGTFRIAAEPVTSKVVWNGRMWFTSGGGVWSSDGTVAGTQQLTLPAGATSASNLMMTSTHLFFLCGGKLWRSDGTTAGTVQASTATFYLGTSEFEDTPTWASTGSMLLFTALVNPQVQLWRADGSSVTMVQNYGTGPSATWPFAAGNLVYFLKSVQRPSGIPALYLYRTDGTASGTYPLPSGSPVDLQSHSTPVVSGSNVYFVGLDANNQRKLWRTDGTDAGTVAIANSLPGASATFDGGLLGRLPNGTLLLIGPSTEQYKYAVWAFDGTNTTLLSNIELGNRSLRAAIADGYAAFGTGGELWRSDGTIGGTYSLGTFTPSSRDHTLWPMVAIGSTLYFGASGDEYGAELWKTSGTVGTASRVKDITEGTFPSTPRNFSALNGGVLFTASSDSDDHSNSGTRDLWFSNGTDAGTRMLLEDTSAQSIVSCGTRAMFSHDDGAIGEEPWITDGTPEGTHLLKDLFPGMHDYSGAQYPNSSYPYSIVCVDDTFYFLARSSNTVTELWRSDGTAAGTFPLTLPGTVGSSLKRLGHDLYFGLTRDSKSELWRSDGSNSGTFMVKALPGYRFTSKLFTAGSSLYFATNLADSGWDSLLWRSDGTAAGTTSSLSAAWMQLHGEFEGRLIIELHDEYTVGRGLCTTDGSEAGTVCFDSGQTSSGGWDFAPRMLNGRLYYNIPGLRTSDGITSSDTGIYYASKMLAVAGGRLYFTNDSTRPSETDGTLAGTRMLMDRSVDEGVSSGGRLFLAADELYAYDLDVTPASFTPRSIAEPGGQQITINGRGFVGPATVKIGGVAAVVGTTTAASITFTAPAHVPGSYAIELALADGRRITLEDELLYTCAAPTAVVGADPPAFCPLTPVTLQGSGGARCEWFPAAGLDDPTSCTPKATVGATTTYTLIVYNASGCASTNHPSVTVHVNPLPDATISLNGSTSASSVAPDTENTVSVPDAGVGATYAWTGDGVTFTAATNARSVTFMSSCASRSVSLTVTTGAGCASSSKKNLILSTGMRVTSMTPRLASPGATITLSGTNFGCASEVVLYGPWWSGAKTSAPVVPVDSTHIQFRFPPTIPPASAVWVDTPAKTGGAASPTGLMRAARRDFSGDPSSEVFWHNAVTGETSVWLFEGSGYGFFGAQRRLTVPIEWKPRVFGDFNGDGRGDLFWQNTSTGQTSIWLMAFATMSAARSIDVPLAWTPVGSADFDGDGKFDLFWSNATTGETSIWFMNGTTSFTPVRSVTVPPPWRPVAFGDFNGDGKGDVFWRQTTTGETSIWLMIGGMPSLAVRSTTVDPAWTVADSGDFNADAHDDILWRNAATGQTAMWFMNGVDYGGTLSAPMPAPWVPAGVGDHNVDGYTDIFWHNPESGETRVWIMSGSYVSSIWKLITVGDVTWKPVK